MVTRGYSKKGCASAVARRPSFYRRSHDRSGPSGILAGRRHALPPRPERHLLNFTTQEDLDHLRRILLADQILAERGTTRYAIAFAWKRAATAPEAGAAETPPKSIGQRLKSFLGV